MKSYSNVSKFGIIVSVIAMLIFVINYLFGRLNNMVVGASFNYFWLMLVIFLCNIIIAESAKKKKEKK